MKLIGQILKFLYVYRVKVKVGSVVVNNIPKYAIVGGQPVKVFSKRDEAHYEKLKKEERFH